MSVVRAFLNGVGTGAGVAWPLFGVLASTFCLGPAAAFPLGVVCIGLFFSITSFIFYQSYTQKIEENRQLNNRLDMQAQQFVRNLHQLVIGINPPQTDLELVDYLTNCPIFDNPEFALPREFMASMLNKNFDYIRNYNSFTGAKKKELLNQLLLSFTQATQCSNQFTYKKTFNLSFPAFVGAFGSIAGCGAGVSGLLVNLGVFSGFGALPMAGIIVLSFATTMALYRANEAVEEEIAVDTKTKIYHSLKELNDEFVDAPVLENIREYPQDEELAEHERLIPTPPLRHRTRKYAQLSQSRDTLFHHQAMATEELEDASSLQNTYA